MFGLRRRQPSPALESVSQGALSRWPWSSRSCDPLGVKIRELISDLRQAGFTDRGGKGSHRNFTHPKVLKTITISGALGDDAKHYQVRAVRMAIEESKK